MLIPPVRTGELLNYFVTEGPGHGPRGCDRPRPVDGSTARIDTLGYMRLGLVAPYGGARSTGGGPPTLFALNPGATPVVGVDIGADAARAPP